MRKKTDEFTADTWYNLRRSLVVDDSAAMRELIGLTLKRQSLDITTCESGSAAVNQCLLKVFDIIFLDIEMPDVDGFETARRVRKIKGTEKTYIVAVTACSVTPAFIQDCMEAGINDCLVKPLQESILRKRLNLWGNLKQCGALL